MACVAVDYPQVQVESRVGWRAWLTSHAATSRGAWVVTWKKASGRPVVSVAELSAEALAFGWVDSQIRGLDEDRSQLLITPRRKGSNWSRVNKDRIAELTAAGLMTPAGLAAVAAAQADGTWTALDDVENLLEPDDLRAALDAEPEARRQWDGFPRSAKRGILEWLLSARTEGTRTKRIEEIVRRAARGERANSWPRSSR